MTKKKEKIKIKVKKLAISTKSINKEPVDFVEIAAEQIEEVVDYLKSDTTDVKDRLTFKQEKFVEEYLTCNENAPQAALQAGYSKYFIYPTSVRLMENPKIQNAIEKRRAEITDKLKVSKEKILAEYMKRVVLDPRQLVNTDGSGKNISDLDPLTAAVLDGFEIKEVIDKNGNLIRTNKYKFAPKTATLDSLSKNLGLFEADNAQKVDMSFAELMACLDDEVAKKFKQAIIKVLDNRKKRK